MNVRGMDFHVAQGLEYRADAFLPFDGDQQALEEAAGLPMC